MEDMPIFYKKNGWTVAKIARELLNMEAGDRFPSVSQYAELYGIGRGTIQYAVQFLLDNGCMSIVKRGSKGSFLSMVDRKKLWDFSDWGTLLCAAPGVVHESIAGLVSGVYSTLKEQDFPFNIVHTSHSGNRLRELACNRYHFVITTPLAMLVARQEYPQLTVVAEMPGCVYLDPYRLFHHGKGKAGIAAGMRMGIIRQSYEQNHISRLISQGKELHMIEMPHQQAVQAYMEGQVDLLVARPSMLRYDRIRQQGFSLSHLGLDRDTTTPVLAANQENCGMVQFLRKWVSVPQIRAIQQEVLLGLRKPMFY